MFARPAGVIEAGFTRRFRCQFPRPEACPRDPPSTTVSAFRNTTRIVAVSYDPYYVKEKNASGYCYGSTPAVATPAVATAAVATAAVDTAAVDTPAVATAAADTVDASDGGR